MDGDVVPMIGQRLFKPAVVALIGSTLIRNIDGDGLRIAFRVARSLTSSPDEATIAVYGLDEAHRTALATTFAQFGRAKATLSVGYDGVPVVAFKGDVRTLRPTVIEGSDIATFVTADDAGDALAEVRLPGLSSAGLTAEDMIDAALAAFALPLPLGAGEVIVKHPSVAAAIAQSVAAPALFAAVSIGKATDLLDEAARILGVRWYVRDNQLFMARRGIPTDGDAVVLNRLRWLGEPSEDAEGLVRLPAFADARLTPGRQVQLVGRVLPGVGETFRVETSELTGDTDADTPFAAQLTLRRLEGAIG